jgi:hypothetical protein
VIGQEALGSWLEDVIESNLKPSDRLLVVTDGLLIEYCRTYNVTALLRTMIMVSTFHPPSSITLEVACIWLCAYRASNSYPENVLDRERLVEERRLLTHAATVVTRHLIAYLSGQR